MNLNEFEKNQIQNFLNKGSNLTQEEQSQIASFINSKITTTVKEIISEDEKEQISLFLNKDKIIPSTISDVSSPKIEKKKKSSSINIEDIVEKVLSRLKEDNTFKESLTEKILPPQIIIDKNEIISSLKEDEEFIKSLIGEKGETGDSGETIVGIDGLDAEVDYEKIITEATLKLKEDVDFISTIKAPWLPGGGLGEKDVVDLINRYAPKGGSISGSYVSDINGINGPIVISGAGNNSIIQIGNTLIVSGIGGSGTVSGSYVRTIDGLSGDIILSAGSNINITQIGNSLIINSSGSSTSAGVNTINTISGDIILSAGPNITLSQINKTITITAATSASGTVNGYFPMGW